MKKQKYYVVWQGLNPGIYTSWTDCLLQTKGVEGAKYKSFATKEEAEKAFSSSPSDYMVSKAPVGHHQKEIDRIFPKEVILNSLAVDAACSGNPGKMEYRGVHVASNQEVFHFGPVYGTNNIGEFLAIVHGLALIKQKGFDMPLYSDSVNAIKWIKGKKCRTKLKRDGKTEELFRLIERAENWLRNNTYSTPIYKWETPKWGECPADFGRK
jgi:ribonuclease HI